MQNFLAKEKSNIDIGHGRELSGKYLKKNYLSNIFVTASSQRVLCKQLISIVQTYIHDYYK